MNPIFIKLIGAAIGSFLADFAGKKIADGKNQKALQSSGQNDKSDTPKAKTGPKEKPNDSKKPSKTGNGGGNQRPDSGSSDKSVNEPGVDENEPDQ